MAIIDIYLHNAVSLRVLDLKFSACLIFSEGLHDSGKDKSILATADKALERSLIQFVLCN